MFRTRAFWVVLTVVVGLLQAWDSGAFAAGTLVGVLATSGIGIVAAAIGVTTNQAVRLTALAVGFALLTVARVVAPSSLNTLHLALFAPAIYVLVASPWFEPGTAAQHGRA
jgi:hypothetical protein